MTVQKIKNPESLVKQNSPIASIKLKMQSDNVLQAFKDAVPMTARHYLTPERIIRIVTTALSRNPKLMECEETSILKSVMDIVQVGLEPGGPLGEAYLVPFRNGKTNRMECQPIIGYKGYIALARRSGEIESVMAETIYSKDEHDIQFGDEPHVKHRKCLTGDRGSPVAVYCVVKLKGGGKHIEVMTMDEINQIKSKSKAKEFGPWVEWPDMMARKTVIKRAIHYLPISTEMAGAAEIDNMVDSGTYINPASILHQSSINPTLESGTFKISELQQQEPLVDEEPQQATQEIKESN